MSQKVICALDVGTTGTRALLVNRAGSVVGSGYHEVALSYPHPGWVEQNPGEIWTKTEAAIHDALRHGGIHAQDVVAIGVTNQRETTILWDRDTGTPVYPAIVWQDRRTQPICERLRAEYENADAEAKWSGAPSEAKHSGAPSHAEHSGTPSEAKHSGAPINASTFASITGLVLDPYFSATKLMWLLDHQPRWRAEAASLAFGTVDAWITWQLTGGREHVTDPSNASRTLLYDIRRRDWSELLLARTDIPRQLLPRVQDTRSHFGVTRGLSALPDGIPLLSLCGDQQASMFGQLAVSPGDWKATYGTGAFLMAVLGPGPVFSRDALTSIAWTVGGQPTYYLEAAVFVCGAVLQWLRDGLGIFCNYDELAAMVKHGRASATDLYCVPALTGFGTPFWNSRARGLLIGLTRGTTRADICASAIEGIAFEVQAAFAALATLTPCRRFIVDGGATRSESLMQFQADVLQREVLVSARQEGTAFGAAFLAGLEAGFWKSTTELEGIATTAATYKPKRDGIEAEYLVTRWHEAARRALDWAQEKPQSVPPP